MKTPLKTSATSKPYTFTSARFGVAFTMLPGWPVSNRTASGPESMNGCRTSSVNGVIRCTAPTGGRMIFANTHPKKRIKPQPNMNTAPTEETPNTPDPTIESLYDSIMASEVFRLDGPAINLPEALMNLANAVHADESDEIDWYMGEHTEACLSDLLPGAYWALTEWHAGQNSETYAAMCAVGQVFNPGMTSRPQSSDDDSCFDAYQSIGGWFEKRTTRHD